MSFSSAVKDEIAKVRVRGAENRRAMLCALTHTAGAMLLGRGLSIQYITENPNVARLIAQLGSSAYSLTASLAVREQDRLRSRSVLVRFVGEGCEALLRDAGYLAQNGEALQIGRIPENYKGGDTLVQSFLRGAFLGAGSITDPKKGYHAEIVCRNEIFAGELCELMNRYELNAKQSARKSNQVVYIKEGDKIADYLRLLGASAATMDFEHTRILRNVSNNLNRQRNFEDANMQKAAQACAQQLLDIELIRNEEGLQSLPRRLFEAAEARLNNPEASLSELSEILEVSKSGLNHRFAKLAERAALLRTAGGGTVQKAARQEKTE